MKSILVQLDDATYRALKQEAPPAKRRQSQFIRQAIRRAIRQAEYERIRRAYEKRPDSESEADNWTTAEEYKR